MALKLVAAIAVGVGVSILVDAGIAYVWLYHLEDHSIVW